MKFLLIAAAVVAVAVAGPPRFILPDLAGPTPIIDIDPNDVLAVNPVIVEDSPISVGPAIVEGSPIDVGPAIIDDSIFVEGANYQPPTPIVQVIINVNSKATGPVSKPQPLPVIVPEDIVVEKPEIKPEEVIVVEQPDIPEEVIVAPVIIPEKPNVQPEPVIVAPIEPSPVINLPDSLN